MCFSIALTKKALLSSNSYFRNILKEDNNESKYFISAFTFPKHPVIPCEYPENAPMFQWGLIPHWTKNIADATKFRQYNLNARSESAFEKPSFRGPIKKKRCLIPVSGFFEWQEYNRKKYPYYITLKNEELFMLGGIYDDWTDKESGEIISSFSILTTEANPMMAKIHNSKLRMPVIIPSENETDWLNNELSTEDISRFFIPFDQDQMKAHTVSKLISSRSKDTNVPEAVEYHQYSELPAY
jgi:putative SOS response-associated peptidase YedK